jgi:hypothetical protein
VRLVREHLHLIRLALVDEASVMARYLATAPDRGERIAPEITHAS